MNDGLQAASLIYDAAMAVAANIAAYDRDADGKNRQKRAGEKQRKAMIDLFTAMTGRLPSDDEVKAMGGTGVFIAIG